MAKINSTSVLGAATPVAPITPAPTAPPVTFANAVKTLAADFATLKGNALAAGRATASGHDSILDLALRVYASAKHSGLASGDVKDIYQAYCEGANSTAYGAKVDIANADSMKAGRSKLLCFHKLAHVPGVADYVSVIPLTIQIANEHQASHKQAKGGSHYERVLRVVRTVIKRGDAPLPDANMVHSILFPPKEDKTVLDRLEAIDKTCQTMIDDEKYLMASYHFQQVQNTVRAQIASIKADIEAARVAAMQEEHSDEPEAPAGEPKAGEPDLLQRFLEAAE